MPNPSTIEAEDRKADTDMTYTVEQMARAWDAIGTPIPEDGNQTFDPEDREADVHQHHCDGTAHASGQAWLWAELCAANRRIAELEAKVTELESRLNDRAGE